jgi:hypothetical protein
MTKKEPLRFPDSRIHYTGNEIDAAGEDDYTHPSAEVVEIMMRRLLYEIRDKKRTCMLGGPWV